MKKSTKIILFIGTALLLAGIAVATISFFSLSREQSEFGYATPTTFTFDTPITAIDIQVDSADVILRPSPDDGTHVSICEGNNIRHTVEAKDGVLTVKREPSSIWLLPSFYEMSVTVMLPEWIYDSASITTAGGNVTVYEGFTFSSLSMSTASGDIDMRAVISDSLTVTTASGDITLMEPDARITKITSVSGEVELTRYNGTALTVESTSGDLELDQVKIADTLTVSTVSGEVELTACDAGEISISTTSGDVTGSLRTPKTFDVHTVSGRVSVPQTTGGICKIHTVSGDVRITVTEE